jgi:hypothetical protein
VIEMSEFTMLNVMLNLMRTSQWLTDHHSEQIPRLKTVATLRHNLAFAKYLDFKFSDV